VVGLRNQINQKPVIAGIVAVAVVAFVVAMVFSQLRGNHPSTISGVQRYYTADDGKNWFADAWEKVPPFDHDGSPAVLCFVFKTSTSPPFAGYLEEYTPQMHDELTGAVKARGAVVPDSGALVKRPGDKTWVPLGSPAGRRIVNVASPKGSAGPLQLVDP
jgi:hypothetical protein